MGSLFSAPLPPGALPDRPITPDPFDPQVEAMRRKRLKKLKRHIPRQATILTSGLGDRTATAPQPVRNRTFPVPPGAPHTANTLLGTESNFGNGRARVRLPGKKHTAPRASRPGSTILTDPLVQLVGVGQTPTPAQPQPPAPQRPDPSQPDPCEAILETLLQLNRELDEIRPKISLLKFRITANEEEIERLKSAPVELPPIPGRLPRRPIKLRKQIPDALKDAEQTRRSIDFFEKLEQISFLEKEIVALKKELEPLEEKERQLDRSQREQEKRLAHCRAANK